MLDTFAIKQKICITLDQSSGANVVPIFNYIPYTKAGYRLINEYLEVNDLKAVTWIYSLLAVDFPIFQLTDSESVQTLAAINLEWQSPRIELDVVIAIDNSLQWQRIAAYSVLNPDPYPYREYSLGNHTLGDNAMLGFQIRDVGFGLLTGAQDKVTIYADLKRIITIEKLIDNSQKITNVISDIAATIVNSNVNRKGLTFCNTSTIKVFVDTASTVSISSHLVELEPGDYWEPPIQSYTGAYYGIVTTGSTAIDIREFS